MKHFYHNTITIDERSQPPEDSVAFQPYFSDAATSLTLLALEDGDWADPMQRERLALALSQVTASHILPPLVEVPTGEDLLNYQVILRDKIDPVLVAELRLVLDQQWRDLDWVKMGAYSYSFVIGAGVAATLDLSRGAEMLSLRYASDLADELYLAGRAIDLPRSRLFLQTALYERVDMLLAQVRERCWGWT
jgi:hypothetical protein